MLFARKTLSNNLFLISIFLLHLLSQKFLLEELFESGFTADMD